jgi:hypothetical protein
MAGRGPDFKQPEAGLRQTKPAAHFFSGMRVRFAAAPPP